MADESLLTQEDTEVKGETIVTEDSPKPEDKAETGAPETSEDKSKDDASKDKEETKEAEPVEYEFEFPEGTEVDEELLGKFKGIAEGLKLSKEGAQELLNLQLEAQNQQLEQWQTTLKEWRDTAEADKEVGGKNFKENVGTARKALNEFGTPELREALDVYGMGNHPEFIRFLYRVGKQMSEDTIAVGGNPKGEAKDLARSLYPTMAN